MAPFLAAHQSLALPPDGAAGPRRGGAGTLPICEVLPLGPPLVFEEAVVSACSDVGARTSRSVAARTWRCQAERHRTGAVGKPQTTGPGPQTGPGLGPQGAGPQGPKPRLLPTLPASSQMLYFLVEGYPRRSDPPFCSSRSVPGGGAPATRPSSERPRVLSSARPHSFTSALMSEIWCHRGN